MSFAELKPETQAIAKRVLTEQQYRVFVLWCADVGTDTMAEMLGLSRSTIRNHKRRVFDAIGGELRRKKHL